MSLFVLPINTKKSSCSAGGDVFNNINNSGIILAHSPNSEDVQFQKILAATGGGSSSNKGPSNNSASSSTNYELLSDRQKPFTHLKSKNFIMGFVRVSGKTCANTLAEYMQDKLKNEMKNEELVSSGKLSGEQADKDNEDWSEKEWNKRWCLGSTDFITTKIIPAWLRYHAVTIVTRFYEYLCSLKCTDVTLDKLTKDMFQASIRYDKQQKSKSSNTSNNKNESNEKGMGRHMVSTCFWSNVLVYLADYSVSQIILLYGVYYYYYYQKKKRDTTTSTAAAAEIVEEYNEEQHKNDSKQIGLHSIRLIVSRSMSLVTGSIGGAIGSTFYPGWGTLIGFNMGDGLAYALLDEN